MALPTLCNGSGGAWMNQDGKRICPVCGKSERNLNAQGSPVVPEHKR